MIFHSLYLECSLECSNENSFFKNIPLLLEYIYEFFTNSKWFQFENFHTKWFFTQGVKVSLNSNVRCHLIRLPIYLLKINVLHVRVRKCQLEVYVVLNYHSSFNVSNSIFRGLKNKLQWYELYIYVKLKPIFISIT